MCGVRGWELSVGCVTGWECVCMGGGGVCARACVCVCVSLCVYVCVYV